MGALDQVIPVFVADADELWGRLRLSGTDAHTGDAGTIMAQGAMWARSQLYDRLGATLIATIKLTPEVADATTDAQIRRTRCSILETMLVRLRLSQDLPVLFRDKSAGSLEVWNTEAPVREIGSGSEMNAYLERLRSDIEDLFDLIDDDDETNPGINTAIIGPEDDAPLPVPGGSVIPGGAPQPWLSQDWKNAHQRPPGFNSCSW